MTRTNKIEAKFGEGSDTIIFDVVANEFFSYELDREALHQRFGGKAFYTSKSGLSGKGYLEPSASQGLVIFGWYRTDAGNQQEKRVVHKDQGVYKVFGYAPIASHQGIDPEAPFVLTDGSRLAYVRACDVRATLLRWESIGGDEVKPIKLQAIVDETDEFGDQAIEYFTVDFHNPNKLRGPRATRFVDLRQWRVEAQKLTGRKEPWQMPTMVCRKLSLVEVETSRVEGRWYHLTRDGIVDALIGDWDGKEGICPWNIKGEVVDGWSCDGDGMFWRQGKEGTVEAFLEVSSCQYRDGKYFIPDETGFFSTEFTFSVIEWYSMNESQRRERLDKDLLQNVARDLLEIKKGRNLTFFNVAPSERPILPDLLEGFEGCTVGDVVSFDGVARSASIVEILNDERILLALLDALTRRNETEVALPATTS